MDLCEKRKKKRQNGKMFNSLSDVNFGVMENGIQRLGERVLGPRDFIIGSL